MMLILLQRLEAQPPGWDCGSYSQNNTAKLTHPRMNYLCHTQETRPSDSGSHNSRYQAHTILATIRWSQAFVGTAGFRASLHMLDLHQQTEYDTFCLLSFLLTLKQDLGRDIPCLPFNINCKNFFPGGSEVKTPACNVGDLGLIPGLGRSPGEGTGNPLQYSCLENPMDGEAWWATVHGVAKNQTRLSDFTSLSLYGTSQYANIFTFIVSMNP